ncbi:glycosyltransferase [Ornithinimicrobium avium]|uniref:GT2 family glycosyltransferase n=1 Tax=Ornithinimicrobium avium TaxID=2283195 RepID=A0A345NLD7_9MICO|nr:glycosyltransferase [Ornithinimicrobium avium]AXH95845.1 hypothetical protein DV701_06615 [Ornithinimicrobium avium]
MTPTDTARAPMPGVTRPGRVRVDDVSVVVLTGPDGAPLEQLLDALAAQTRLPQRLLVTGLDPDDEEAAALRAHPLVARLRVPLLVRAPLVMMASEVGAGRPTPGRVLEDARTALPVHEHHWLWVLHDDSVPEPGALAALEGAVLRNSRTGVVGPKLVRLDDPRLLVGVGHHLTVGGRATDAPQAALVDQGQLDLRRDVIGVPLAGSLLRSDVLAEAGGLDPAFGDDGVAGLDVGWRSHLVGQRVVVAPEAVVRQGETGLGVLEPRRTRVRQRQLALARGSGWAAPWRGLGIVVTSALAALLLLLVKRPEAAADEWADVRAVLSPGRSLGARARFRSRRTVRPRDLRSLFVPPGAGWRAVADTVTEALDPRERARPGETLPGRSRGGVETGPVSDEFAELGADRGRPRIWSWPLCLALVVATVLAGWWWRDLLPALTPEGTGVAGGELGPATTDAAGLWRSALDGWRGGGLGDDRVAEAWLLPLALLARMVEAVPGTGWAPSTAGVALGWLLLASVPASVLTAYLALRRATRRRWLRAGLALGWAGAAPLAVAVGDGRAGPVVVHVLAPLLLAGYAVCATRAGGARRTAALFATVLGVALAAQWVPLVLPVATLGGAALVVLGRGSARWRGVALAVLPWPLLLPWLPAAVSGPVQLLGGAGATVADVGFPVPVAPWQTLLLRPGPGVPLASAAEALAPDAMLLWLAVPMWLAALGALALRGRRGRRAAVLVAAALVLVGLAALVGRLSLGVLPQAYDEAGSDVVVWDGTLLSLAGAAVLIAGAVALDRLLAVDRARRPQAELAPGATETVGAGESGEGEVPGTDDHHGAGRRRARPAPLLAGVLTGAVVLAGLASLGAVTMFLGTGELEPAVEDLPAVALEQARGPAAQRTLVLVPLDEDRGAAGSEGVVAVAADLRGAEAEPPRILRDRTRDLGVGVPDHGPVVEVVAAMTGDGEPAAVRGMLERLGVGYVLVEASADAPLATQVDLVPGLTRVSSPEGQVVWRMTSNEAARVRVLAADGQSLGRLEATGPHAASAGTLKDLPEGAVLEVAEGQGWSRYASVDVDGHPVGVGRGNHVLLPAGTHEVDVEVRTPRLAWHVLALVLAAVVAFLALPFGRNETDPEEQTR